MKLHEYQSKLIFARYAIPIPRGRVVRTASEAKQVAEELGSPVVIKSQVLVAGRGKAGGIRLAKTPKEAEELATHILGMEIKGCPVRKILVDEGVNIAREFYLGITIDRSVGKPVMLASAEGGVDIEEVALHNPEKICHQSIDPLLGLRDFQARDLAAGIDLPREQWRPFIEISRGLWKVFLDCDATLVEVNPLVISAEQKLLALDGKIIIDDNGLIRHPDLVEIRDIEAEDSSENEARKYGLSYIRLDGNIGCMVNGAGLAMAATDVIKMLGGEPANFLDIGGGAGAEKVSAALRILLGDQRVKSVMINVFGGITRCDEVARGILAAIYELKPQVPIIVRLVGTNAEEGRKLLQDAKLETAESLNEAATKAIRAAKETFPK